MKSGDTWVRLYRNDIEAEQDLTPREFQLFHFIRRNVGWDQENNSRHFLRVEMSIKRMSEELGPKWKEKTTGDALRGLIRKGYVKQLGYRQYRLTADYIRRPMKEIRQHNAESKLEYMRKRLALSKKIPRGP